jgi:hypothetical protein
MRSAIVRGTWMYHHWRSKEFRWLCLLNTTRRWRWYGPDLGSDDPVQCLCKSSSQLRDVLLKVSSLHAPARGRSEDHSLGTYMYAVHDDTQSIQFGLQ